jgi:inorganic pyrophosphatase
MPLSHSQLLQNCYNYSCFARLQEEGQRLVAKASKKKPSNPVRLNPFDRDKPGVVRGVIETPGGSRNKFKYDEKLGFFSLSGVLPEGMVFPHAFGFVPSTKADDGDPEDILIIMDEPTFTGCVVPCRLLGVMEAEQTEDGKSERNDRLIAVADQSRDYSDVKNLKDLNSNMLKEIEQFFITYNKERGKKFKVLRMRGPRQALKLVKKSLRNGAGGA